MNLRFLSLSTLTLFVLLAIPAFVVAQDVRAKDKTSEFNTPPIPECMVGVDCETGHFGQPERVIREHPEPAVRQVYADHSIVFDRRYRRVNGSVSLYDAPYGNAVSRLDSGFNFVTLIQEHDGWAQIGPNRWVRSEHLTANVTPSTFAGMYLPEEELPFTVAWLLVHVVPSRTPGGEPDQNNPRLLRYTTVYLYDTVLVDDWRWYQIGVNQWVHQTQVAKIIPVERPVDVNTERWFSIDLYEQVLIAYEGEQAVYATLISSGLATHATNEGLFNVYLRYERAPMSGLRGTPDFYYLQEVPWIMYFDNDIGLHGAYWHDGFGYRRSRGCVNMSIMDSYLLYRWAAVEFDASNPDKPGAAVYVYSSGEYR